MSKRFALLTSTILTGMVVVSPGVGRAQAVAASPDGQLSEIVVTATRREDTVNRVALSVTAKTQATLDQQGIRTLADLAFTVPSMAIQQTVPGVANISIRGVQNYGPGAATTGFYLDDTPLTKRNALGCCTNNGSPLPPLFDLERVEVLRGPQGTLFGSGSQGGTVRYITPTPSLTRYSLYSRIEASTTSDGKPSYDIGVAGGGPIIEDKLAFRVSVDRKHTGGWLDYVNPVTAAKKEQNANSANTFVMRGSLLVALDRRTRVTGSVFHSMDLWRSRDMSWVRDTAGPITETAGCYDPAGRVVACTAANVSYRRGPLTLPQLTGLGRESSINAGLTPAKTRLGVVSIAVDHDFDGAALRAISSYIEDRIFAVTPTFAGTQNRLRGTTQTYNGYSYPAQGQYAGLAGYPVNYNGGDIITSNRRYGFTQEVRLASTGDPKPFNWVVGAFYSNQRNTQNYDYTYPDFDLLVRSLLGISALQRYGVPMYPYQGQAVGWSAKYQTMKDTEVAAFGEANYWLTEALKLSLGLRVSRLGFDYFEVHYGPAAGGNNPAAIPGGVTGPASGKESVVAPKFGLQYQLSESDMVYATAAKGFRAGGVNASVPEILCATTLAQFGATVSSIPGTYRSDSVWSYELGGKARMLDRRLQVNGAVYRIDWKNLQTNVTIPSPCIGNFIGNAAKARSQGFELEMQGRVARGLIANLAVGYTDAKYIGNAYGIGQSIVIALDGQRISVPPWTVQMGLRYDRQLTTDIRAYVRGDFRYIARVKGTAAQTFGLTAFAPDARFVSTNQTNLRMGIERGPVDLNFFVNNLFDSRKGDTTGGRSSCPSTGAPACTNPGIYNPYFSVASTSWPRQIGLQFAYRY